MDRLKKQVESVLKLEEVELRNKEDALEECLNLLEKEVLRVRENSNGYPNSTIAGDVWFDGTALANYGESIANHLSGMKFLEHQAKATQLWTGAVLSVCSHYHHMVGPAMIANARISEKTGNLEYSKTAYSAVLQDFECILEYAEDDDLKPEGDDLVALDSLLSAAIRLVELNELDGVNAVAPEIIGRIEAVLQKPVEG